MGDVYQLRGYRILSISSAAGWSGLLANDDFTDYTRVVLVCWVLVEKDERQQIVGICAMDEMKGELSAVDFRDDFFGFKHDTEEMSKDEIRSRLKVLKEIKEMEEEAEAPPQAEGD